MFRRILSVVVSVTVVVVAAMFAIGPENVIADFQVSAGDIGSATWTLSSSTEGAKNVTYTHQFTTQTVIPALTGSVGFEVHADPGMSLPDFAATTLTLGSGSTAGLAGRTIDVRPRGSEGAEIHVFPSTDIPAGTVKLVFTGVTNPSKGGALGTNTWTEANFNFLDGKPGPDFNAQIEIGTEVVTGTVTDLATGSALAGIPLELHGNGPGGNNFFRSTTDATGDYDFFGVSAGTYMLELSHMMDPGSSKATTISQYLRFEPIQVTVPASGTVTQNIALKKSSKLITGKVKYADTGDVVKGANVNAFSMGPGGFAFGQTGTDGTFTLRVGGGSFFVQVMPSFGGPSVAETPPGGGQPGGPGGSPGGPGGQPPQQANDFFPRSPQRVSFVQGADTAETIAMGDILVDKADATVTGKLQKPDGSAITGGGMGAMNFRTHTMIPIQLDPTKGTFSFKAKSETGTWELNFFDPNASFAMPDLSFKIKAGTNDLGTVKMLALDKTITVNIKRIDSGKNEGVGNVPVMVFNTKKPGPPYMGFSGSDGVATVKVPTGFEGRVMAMPGGEGGPGKQGGPGGGGPEGGKKMGWLDMFNVAQVALAEEISAEQAQAQNVQEVSRLFPVTPPQRVKAGDTVTMNFDLADKAVTVRTLKKDGTTMSDGGFVSARRTGSEGPSMPFGGPTAGGQGMVYTTSGEFVFSAFLPPDSAYLGVPKTVTISGNTTVDLTVAQKTVTVTGEVRDASNNNAVIKDGSLNIMIGLFAENGFSDGTYNPATGTYTASFIPDTKFRVGVAAGDPGMGISEGGYIPNVNPTELSGTDGQTLTHHVTLAKVDAKIKGKITDQNGTAVEGVTVTADPGLFDLIGEGPGGPGGPGPGPGPGGPGEGPEFGFSDVTASDGTYTINVSANKYKMVVNARADGLFATGAPTVDIGAGQTKDSVNMTLQRADATVAIEADGANGKDLAGATAHFFNDAGTIAFSVQLDDNGKGTAAVPAGEYRMKVGRDLEADKPEESPIATVVAASGKTVTEMLKTETQKNALPAAVVQEASADSTTEVAVTQNGEKKMAFTFLSGALSGTSSSSSSDSSSSSSGSPIVAMAPIDGTLPITKTGTPVGTGVSLDITDANGNAITSFTTPAPGLLTYKDEEVPKGVDEKNLKPMYFDEQTQNWVALQGGAVDTVANTVSFTTTHATDFAVVAAADTTAAAAPTSVKATDKTTGGAVTLSWTNPTDSDFAKVNIYQSTAEGTVGDKVATTTSKDTTSYDLTGLTDGTKYFFTVRSLDTADNESTNTDQVSATPTKAAAAKTLPKTGEPTSPWTSLPGLLALAGAAGLVTRGLQKRHAAHR
ncbi:fibronectin type III domain-containing protein [Candidatus Berkelbacteria bacterium]|nr:fibronectin type III domain-containing protein [Candidatus Berkelbacteria bacterium]